MRRTEACREPRRGARWLLLALSVAAPGSLRAAEVTDTATAFEADNPFDFRLRVGYQYSTKTAAIKREHEGAGQQKVEVFKDLVYQQTRHTMGLRAEFGLYQDLMFSVELPFVMSDNRSLSYDQRLGGGCNYVPTDGNPPNCVNADNSSTTNSTFTEEHNGDTDPTHYIVPFGGYDAPGSREGQQSMYPAGDTRVFGGPSRGGSGGNLFDTLNLGLTYALLSQRRDDTKPTWIINLEYQLSIGTVMTFSRDRPDANHGISDGLDHIVAKTAVSRRFKWVDPYAVFWFDYPFVRRDDTLYWDLGATAKNQMPQMSGGVRFGLEGVPYEKVKEGYKIALDVNARIEGKFDGRGYSEIWEMLASSPALACDPKWNPACDSSMTINKYQGKPYSGLTTIENYASIGAEAALTVQATKYVRFRANFIYKHDQSHLLTTDDVGKPTTAGSRVSAPGEYNPAFRPIINEVGRRYKVDDVDMYTVGLWGQMMF